MAPQIHILLVEDDPITAASIESGLLKAGFPPVTIVSTGEEAIETALVQPPELILTDIQLAGRVNGIEAVEQIRAAHGNIPVIFFTAFVDADYRSRAERLEPLAYLIKPVSQRQIRTAIELAFQTPPPKVM